MIETYTKAKYITNEGEIIEFDNYEISNYGNIRRCYKNGKIRKIKLQYDRTGYMYVSLSKNNKNKFCTIHRLVLSSFQNNQYFPGANVDHINSIRNDNRLENLRWITQKENNNTDHHKKAISEARKGKKHSDEVKQKISKAQKGMKFSDDHKQKLSEAHKGKMKGSNNPRAQSCIYDNKEFGCIKEAYHYAIENGLFDKSYDTFREMIKHKK